MDKTKDHYTKRADRELADNLEQNDLSIRQQLTVAARMMAIEGHDAGVAGQITAKAKQPGTFWTLRLGRGFDEATPAEFLLVDDDLKTLEGEGHPNPATRFHMWVYRSRPDLNAIFHAHPPYVSALSTLQTPLIIAHMDQTPFMDDCAFLAEWPGLPIADDEGRIITNALGDKMSIILAHHGYLTSGRTVAQASFLSVYLERAARMQMRAAAVGEIKPVDQQLGLESRQFLKSPLVIDTTFAYFTRKVINTFGADVLDER